MQHKWYICFKKWISKRRKEYTKQIKIKLLEIRQSNDNDWKERMINNHYQLNAYFKHIIELDIKFDKEWLKS